MNLDDAIRTRRSIRKYQDRDVPTEMILKALDLACWAPNGGNYQPWKFYVVENRGLISRIADAVKAKTDLIASWPEAEDPTGASRRYESKEPFLRTAPVVIVATLGGYQSGEDRVLRRRGESDPDAREMLENRAAVSSRTQTIAGAVAYLLLGLHQQGLGACWMGGPMIARREIAEMLDLPANLEPFAVIPVGYPTEAPAAKPRKPREETVQVIE